MLSYISLPAAGCNYGVILGLDDYRGNRDLLQKRRFLHNAYEAVQLLEHTNGDILIMNVMAYAEYNFFGTGIKWFGTTNFDCGKADVIIDGNYMESVDTYSPVRLANQLLYINTKLSVDHHIIKIFCAGEKNDKATNCDVVVESFQHLTWDDIGLKLGAEGASYSQMSRKAKEIIKANYTQDLSISQLTSTLGVSRSYFTSRFTADLGISPSQFLAQVRIEQSKQMLLDTENLFS